MLIILLLLCALNTAAGVALVAEGDSLTQYNYGFMFNGWPDDTTNSVWVTNNAVSGSALLDYPGNPYPIEQRYYDEDQPVCPRLTGTNAFFVLNGVHGDLYSNRWAEATVFNANTALLAQAHADGFIVVGCTLAPSLLLTNSGAEQARLKFNADMRAATNAYDALMEWDKILPADYITNPDYSLDGTHPTDLSAHLLAEAFDSLSENFPLASITARGNVLNWPGYFRLLESHSPAGPWTDTGARVGPFTNGAPGDNFYTLRP
jgi:hypothetical protein